MFGVKSIPIEYADFDSYAMNHMEWEEIMIKILVHKTRQRWGSVEKFLRLIEEGKVGEYLDKLKKDLTN